MNRKMLAFAGAVAFGIILCGDIAHADELEEFLKLYIEESKFDYLGRNFDREFFKILEGEDPSIINKIKGIPQDFKTMILQAKCYYEMWLDDANALSWLGLSGTAGFKTILGPKEFSKIMKMLFKIKI